MGGEGPGTTSPFVLAIDTSVGAASACLLALDDMQPLTTESMVMERGHAEALIPMLDRVVSRAPGGFSDVVLIAVAIGPGSFTGIRVGVAAARALGLACDVPVVGVSTLAALAAPSIAAGLPSTVVAAIDARHGSVYVQSFVAGGATDVAAAVLSVPEAVSALGPGPFRFVGSGASMMAIEAWSHGIEAEVDEKSLVPDIAFVARLGLMADAGQADPVPLYLKPPDAKPQTRGVIERQT